MKPSRIMLMVAMVVLPLFVYGSVAMGADDQTADRAPNAGLSGFEGVLAAGDILWTCDIEHFPNDSDNQCLGVQYDGYYYYVTGGGGSFYAPDDTNKVHIWQNVGGSCQYVCSVNQPTESSWGWRDMAYDGIYVYASEEPDPGGTACTVQAWTADCDSVTLYPSADIVLTLADFPGLSLARALAYDPANDWFWTSDWDALYAFDRSGSPMYTIANPGNPVYGLAWDDVSPGGPFLWASCQNNNKLYQVDPNAAPGSEWTGVVYSGAGDVGANVAGGLCLNREGCLSLVGICQNDPDSMYAIEIDTNTVFTHLDTLWVPWAKVGRFANDRPVLGFRIECVKTADWLESVTMESFLTKAFSVDTVRLYAETNGIQGLQVPGDTKIGERNTYGMEFDSEDTLRFFNLHYPLVTDGSNKFYVALNAHSDSIGTDPIGYDGQHLEVIIRPDRIVLNSGRTNPDTVFNRPYNGVDDDSTGFCPNDPNNPGVPGCRYRLVFDTEPPAFDIHYAVLQSCAPDTIDQEDTVRIWATGVAADMCSILVPLPFFGFPNFVLKGDTPIPWEDTLIIPDTNWTMPPAIDIDTGYTVEATGVDTAGNFGYDTIYFNEPIDTYKPVIDSTMFFIAYDANNDGSAALGDSLGIIVFCENNPKFEVSRGVYADLSNYFPTHPSMQIVECVDFTNNNWIFRATVYLDPDSAEAIDYAADSSLNVLYITAYDNACNYQMDTASLGAPIDLEKPIIAGLFYLYHWDHDTTHWCIGIGDSVKMGADLSGSPDVDSVWVDMFDAGIDSGLAWRWYPLFDDGDGPNHNDPTAGDLLYNLLWQAGNPPLADGKDEDNTVPPALDNDYSVLIKATDDVGNWDTLRSPQLNRTLDTRRPRAINPASLQIAPIAGAKIEIRWPRTADENDAWWFYIDSTTDLTHWGEVGNFWDGWSGPVNNVWESEPLVDGHYYCFRITTKDNCDNLGPYTVNICALADGTPPNACIVFPDSGLTFGDGFVVKARSEDEDIDSVSLWYRLWPNYPDPAGRGSWTECSGDMYRPDEGFVFFDTVECIHDYIGWVELLPLACDVIGNCQDIDSAYAHACLDDEEGNLVPGHFFFYWDTTACVVQVASVNDTIWPQSACGFNVRTDTVNTVVFDVVDAGSDLFTIDVRALVNHEDYRIDYRNDVAMPCTVEVHAEGWPSGTQHLYAYVTNQENGLDCVPSPLTVDLCVPEEEGPCMRIVAPHEWQRIPCSKTDMTCVPIWAEHSENCDTMVTQVQFRWAPAPDGPWYFIDEVFYIDGGYWKTCWNNKEWFDADILHDGDTVYFIAIGYDQYHVVDTSEMVKVFLDCQAPTIQLRIPQGIVHECGIDKVTGTIELHTYVVDPLNDINVVQYYYKAHDDPDMWPYWQFISRGLGPDNQNIYVSDPPWNTSGLSEGYYDVRVIARDRSVPPNVTYDFDEDGQFDDNTFVLALADSTGMTVYVDNEAPQPAVSRVVDTDEFGNVVLEMINPDDLLGGNNKVYTRARDSVTVEISVLPSEDTCAAFKVEYYGCNQQATCLHVGTSTDPIHFPVTFEPISQGLIPYQKIENSWWQGTIKAVLFDHLGNSKETEINWWILDVTPSQAMIVEPLNDSYVWGDVTLKSKALNAYEICEVCYQYRPDGDTAWYPVLNGCSYDPRTDFEITWHTLNTIQDGVYYLRAKAKDCSENIDTMPPTIRVTVANELPTAVIEDPRVCERECPDDPVDTLGYVAGTVSLYATVSSDIPVDRVVFYRKDIFTFPSDWYTIGTDYFPTDRKYSVEWTTPADGRYHVKARAYNAAGRYGDSEPVTVTVDNSAPFTQVISIMGDPNPSGMDITKGDVIDIEVVAIDSTSDEGWTRCYNSGVVSIEVCIVNCAAGGEYTKCFQVDPAYDGFHTVQWNTSGLEFEGCSGCYDIYVKATDCLGNTETSSYVRVWVSDITPPITTIGGFDANYVYGYSSEKLSSLQFQYADSGTTDWIAIGWSDYIGQCGSLHLYKTSWDPCALYDTAYQIRVISHDTCSNQDDSLAPVAYFTVDDCTITPYAGGLEAMMFVKNWCVGEMHGVVQQTSTSGQPVMIARYLSDDYYYECLDMQSHLQYPTRYAGSFNADDIDHGGWAKFFSSVTVDPPQGPQTGEPAKITYLKEGSFDIVTVKCDLGTHGTYVSDAGVEVTIPDGAINCYDHDYLYIWVAPTFMEWAPVTQPDILPIGDDNGYATYVSFTDCGYCCGYCEVPFGGQGPDLAGAGTSDDGYCCLENGKYAIIKMFYDSSVDVPAESLAVAWWDCEDGEYCFDNIFYPATVEGFNVEQHYVEFATTCLQGPFVVIQKIDMPCTGPLHIDELSIWPLCNNYTGITPRFTARIADDFSGVDESSIMFKMSSGGKPAGQTLITIYDGSKSGCNKWAYGFGNYCYSGYDDVSKLLSVGWSVSDYNCPCDDENHYYPADPLEAGNYVAQWSAMNNNNNSCTRQLAFQVDATEPELLFADSAGAYVGKNPHFCMYIWDTESGIAKDSIWMDIYAGESTNPYPSNYQFVGKIAPDQLKTMWDGDTLCVDLTFEFEQGGYMHIYVYDGQKCGSTCPGTQYDDYFFGVSDCVGNKRNVDWRYYTIDSKGPVITWRGSSWCDRPLLFEITDAMSGLHHVKVYEDSVWVDTAIVQDPHDPDFWHLTPSAGAYEIDIEAMDNMGNKTIYTFYNTADCAPPVVTWMPGWVNCTDPTVTFQVTDDVSGVDWSTVNVDLYFSSERIQTFAPSDITPDEDGYVTVTGDGDWLGLYDNASLNVVVYSQKSYGTSYTRGPADLEGNYETSVNYFKEVYKADCYAPTITWKSGADSCARPLEFEVKDARSGIATITITEDETEVDFYYNDTTKMLSYSPSAGGLAVLITATDNVSNVATYSFISKEDCTPPVVTFLHDYVSCTPTVSVVVTDDDTVDWSTVHVDLYRYSDYVQTFAPEDIDTMRNGDTVTVTGDPDWLKLTNNSYLYVVVYSEKTHGTSYQKGPRDVSGNYHTSVNYYRENYTVDCVGPSVSWQNSSDPCERPLVFKITDGVSGVAEVKAYEGGEEAVEGAIAQDAQDPDMWNYQPPSGQHEVDIVATDHMGNVTVYSFESTDDCEGPAVTFIGGYVTKNPVIRFVVTDEGAGVDWSTVNAYVSGCGEECIYLAPELKKHVQNDTVTLDDCHLDCNDGNEVELYIYSGSNWYGKGPADLAGNYSPSYYKCSYVVDAAPPYLVTSIKASERPIEIKVKDDRSGIDWSTLLFYEDSVELCNGLDCRDTSVVIDTAEGVIKYMPPAGRLNVQIHLRDYAGNLMVITFYTEEEKLSFSDPHNYPNPFDPREGRTTIVLGLTKSAYVTAKIYDFAGEFVKLLRKDVSTSPATIFYWDGKTDDGTEVADGTYLCYIHGRDGDGAVKTAVIKITVLKKDK